MKPGPEHLKKAKELYDSMLSICHEKTKEEAERKRVYLLAINLAEAEKRGEARGAQSLEKENRLLKEEVNFFHLHMNDEKGKIILKLLEDIKTLRGNRSNPKVKA